MINLDQANNLGVFIVMTSISVAIAAGIFGIVWAFVVVLRLMKLHAIEKKKANPANRKLAIALQENVIRPGERIENRH